MKERLEELYHKYDKQIDKGNKTIRIDVDDYLELKGIAEYSLALQSDLERESE